MRIGFIGAGKAGCSFGKYIAEAVAAEGLAAPDFRLSGYFSRKASAARDAAGFTGSRAFATMEDLLAESEFILLAVPDGAVAEVWGTLRSMMMYSGKSASQEGACLRRVIGHLSGSLDAKVFAGAAELSCSCGSIHPLAALHDHWTAWKILEKTYFTIEGDIAFALQADALLTTLGNPFCMIDATQKTLYHTASTTISNFVAAVAFASAEMYKACGLPRDFAENAWRPLFSANAKNIVEIGPVRALTGPVERGDAQTIKKHLDALQTMPDPYKKAYRALSEILLDVVAEKHPDRNYDAIRELLG
jgi:predicted short-subunit dehydrogenase-like oxidoreductase (DUF2520 family)